jgi:hypothetical protein
MGWKKERTTSSRSVGSELRFGKTQRFWLDAADGCITQETICYHCTRGLKATFDEKCRLLTWADESTEGGRKARHPSLFVSLFFALSHSLLQSLCSHLGIQEGLDTLPGIKAPPD